MSDSKLSFWKTPSGWAALGLIAAASYFLFFEHGEHVWPYLPYLILLLCPFMHFFMHGSHGHGHHDGEHRKTEEQMTLTEERQQKTTTNIEEKRENDAR
jgi:hypothetical protein|uniref:DUF2933 domain-containing protein n=1 Tax=Ningiella ruwaisensis TaxID=2364274 RepID=UPI0010A08E12|nr:DUF2933 domain-containing protein [Ningiella ruwaisensis]